MISRILLITFLFLGTSVKSYGQIELRMNPFSIFSGNANLHAEYHLKDHFSLELQVSDDKGLAFGSLGIGNIAPNQPAYKLRLIGKYYYNPFLGGDKWFSSLYISHKKANILNLDFLSQNNSTFIQNLVLAGFGTGYKWYFLSGLSIETSLGYARALLKKRKDNSTDEITTEFRAEEFFYNITIGYRFTKNDKKLKGRSKR